MRFQRIYDLKAAADEIDIPAIVERKAERLRAGLDPEFNIHLEVDSHPKLWKWVNENDADTICGCPLVWWKSNPPTPPPP